MPTSKPDGRDRRDLRERRSTSRGPEPTQHADRAAAKVKTKEKTFMDRWVEPSLAAPKASYQDHGGLPYGVLEHMQPLGEAPNPKVKARVKPDASRKSVPGRSSTAAVAAAAAAAPDVQESPEGSPTPVMPSRSVSDPPAPVAIVDDDDKDADYAPNVNGKRKERATRRSTIKREIPASDTKPPPTPTPASTSKTKIKTKPGTKAKIPAYENCDPSLPRPNYDEGKLRRVIAAAKRRAVEVGKPELADAVNEIYEQSKVVLELRLLLEAILQQRATKQQADEFHKYVRAAKRKLKEAKSKPGELLIPRRHVPSVPTQGNPPPPSFPGPAATTTHDSAVPSTEQPEPPVRPRISLKVKSPVKKEPGHARTPLAAGLMSKSPRKRADSVGSDSSLTSLTSNEDSDGWTDTPDADPPSPPPKTNGHPGKPATAARGTLAPANAGVKRSSTDAGLEPGVEDERERAMIAKKRKLSQTITRDDGYYEESNIRPAMSARTTRNGLTGPHTTQSQYPSLPLLKLPGLGTRNASRAPSMGADSTLSSVSASQDSPGLWKGAPKPPRKRAKTKQSPEKKSQAANSGLGGVDAAGVDSPIGDDDNEEMHLPRNRLTPPSSMLAVKREASLTDDEQLSENNDFCSACGGSGYLLCCDGCDRSFHFSCLDPPLGDDAKELDEPWFCYVCVAKRAAISEPAEKPLRGLFAPLLGGLKKRNPVNFMLPSDIRDFFEGATTDRNGNFVEAVNKPTRSRPGYSGERPDFKRLRDAKGVTIHCYACGLSSQGRRDIISCDFCTQHWHLDCLDPPLSNAPGLNQDGFKVSDWMCPLHVDKELRQVDTGLLTRRKIHIRRPKGAKVFETALTRGFRNNGIIEILDDSSDNSDSEFYEHDDGGTIYKLPASGIKLDFIDKVKSTRVQQIRDERAQNRARLATPVPSALLQANFAKRPFVEKQLALNLAQFATDNKDLDLGNDQVETLVGTLIAEAPVEVVREMTSREDAEKAKSASSAIPPSPPASEQPEQLTEQQRKELRLLQELIRRKLEGTPT